MKTLDVYSESELNVPEYHIFMSEYTMIKKDTIRLMNEAIVTIRNLDYDNVTYYNESIKDVAKKIFDKVKGIFKKVIQFIKKIIAKIVNFLGKPFGVKLNWFNERSDSGESSATEGDDPAEKGASMDNIKDVPSFTPNPKSIEYDIDVVKNPIPYIEDFFSTMKGNFEHIKGIKGNVSEEKKIGNLSRDRLSAIKSWVDTNSSTIGKLLGKSTGVSVDELMDFLKNVITSVPDNSLKSGLKDLVETTLDTRSAALDKITRIPNRDIVSQTMSSSNLTNVFNEELYLLQVADTHKLYSKTEIPGITLAFDILIPVSNFITLIEDDTEELMNYGRILGEEFIIIDKDNRGNKPTPSELKDKYTSVTSIFSPNNIPERLIIELESNEVSQYSKEQTARFLNLLSYVQNKQTLARVTQDSDGSFINQFGIDYKLNSFKLNSRGDIKKLFEVLTKDVQHSIENAEEINDIFQTYLDMFKNRLDKLEDEKRVDGYKSRMDDIKEEIEKEYDEHEKKNLFDKNQRRLSEDLNFIKEVFVGSIDVLEDLIEFTVVAEVTERAVLSFMSMGIVEYYFYEILTGYKDLVFVEDKTPAEKELLNDVEDFIEENFMAYI